MVGIQTIKSLAVEPSLRTQWERLAGYVKTSFSTAVIASLGQNAIQYINKVTMALVLYFGALAVINNEMTVGALVAFNMIMGQVTAPILRLSQLWQDFQQVRISVDRLGDILNFPTESRSLAQAHLPPAKGEISVRNVTFRYHPQTAEACCTTSPSPSQRASIGIVDPRARASRPSPSCCSGSICRSAADHGRRHRRRHVDPAWLRRQIGVVLQENMLFNRTVHDNIALANPACRAAPLWLSRVSPAPTSSLRACRSATTRSSRNAAPICRAASASAGDRARLATNPRILIFDEATSALDYESERVIQDNMQHICRGRTVIIIAHRLAAVRRSDRIITIQEGRIVEDGSHVELLAKPDSVYGKPGVCRRVRKQRHERKVETLPAKLPAQAPSVLSRLKGGLKRLTFDRDAQEFLPAHIEILQTPTSPMAVTILWTICLMFTAALVWSILAKLDIHAVASRAGCSPTGAPSWSSRSTPAPSGPSTCRTARREGRRRADRARPDRGARGRRRGDTRPGGRRRRDHRRRRRHRGACRPGDDCDPFGEKICRRAQREETALAADLGQYFSTLASLQAQLAEKRAQKVRFSGSTEAREKLMAILKQRVDMRETLVAREAGTKAAVLDALQLYQDQATSLAYERASSWKRTPASSASTARSSRRPASSSPSRRRS